MKGDCYTQLMTEHEHVDSKGFIHKCYHKCKNVILTWQFWLGITLSFPLEHALYDYVPPFTYIMEFIVRDH